MPSATRRDRWLWAFGRWTPHRDDYPEDRAFLEFMRFNNIDEGPEPRDIDITWLPDEPVAGLPKGGMEPCPVAVAGRPALHGPEDERRLGLLHRV